MSEPRLFHDGRVVLHAGDCLDALRALPDCSVDSCVTDPPYHLTSIVRRFGGQGAAPARDYSGAREDATGAYARASRGFMGKQWDGGDIAFRRELWAEVLRVLRPGGHVLAFSATRTYHRMASAIDDAGFEIRDMQAWLYGSGFPKSHDVSKAIDRALGAERAVIAEGAPVRRMIPGAEQHRNGWEKTDGRIYTPQVTRAGSAEAEEWAGWGTALKPALEPICLARKPLAGTVAANVLAHGVGALNIDGCRVDFAGDDDRSAAAAAAAGFAAARARGSVRQSQSIGRESRDGVNRYDPRALSGRWPANVAHDGSDEVVAAFPETGAGGFPANCGAGGIGTDGHAGQFGLEPRKTDSGSAARFFYSAKADAADRLGSKHPTVKPVDLMRWLVRLVTPRGGTVLDPFAGTGTTAAAALIEGMSCVLCEREAEYRADIARRMDLVFAGAVEKASAKPQSAAEDLPLFGGSDEPSARRGGQARLRRFCRGYPCEARLNERRNPRSDGPRPVLRGGRRLVARPASRRI